MGEGEIQIWLSDSRLPALRSRIVISWWPAPWTRGASALSLWSPLIPSFLLWSVYRAPSKCFPDPIPKQQLFPRKRGGEKDSAFWGHLRSTPAAGGR